MKIYLSGAMRGVEDENREAFFQYAAILRSHGHDVWVPHSSSSAPCLSSREFFQLDCSRICMWADQIAVIPGWEKSKGVLAEIALADAVGIPVVYLHAA